MLKQRTFNRNFALAIVIVLTVFLLIALKPYYTAILAAVVLYALFNPVYKKLNLCIDSKKRKTCAIITLLIILLIVIVPLFIIGNIMVKEVTELSKSSFVLGIFDKVQERFAQASKEQVENIVKETSTKVFNYLKDSFSSILSSVANFFIGLVITFMLLYFMFINSEDFKKHARDFIPFNTKNTKKLMNEFRKITYSMVVGSGLIALIQGALVAIGFVIFGVKGAVVWGFISAVLAFLPLVGSALVYIPAGLILLFQSNYFGGIGIMMWGLIIVSNSDNVIRPIVGRRMANVHPLITLIGVFIGLNYIGVIGIIIGPLLLSYFFLLTKMFKEEYIGKKKC